MSNSLAIATVTAALRDILQQAALASVAGATVTTRRPEKVSGDAHDKPGINLFLFQVTPNTALSNADLATRDSSGALLRRPQIALDLYYLLTFLGSDLELEPQRLLGSAAIALHAQPYLGRDSIRETIRANTFLAQSDLDNQVEQIKFGPLNLTLEELSKLWSVFFQIPYALSAAYRASVVLIEADVTPRAAAPVLRRNLYVAPARRPSIEAVESAAGPDQPIAAGDTLIIRGRDLRGDETRVLIGGAEYIPEQVSDTRVVLPLAGAAPPRAGLHGVQVVHLAMLGTPPAPHRGIESNVAAVVLRPSVTRVDVANLRGSGSAPRSADLTVGVSPAVGAGQRAVLLLNEQVGESAAYAFAAPPRPADTDAIVVPISGVKPGVYRARVQVDGAESLPGAGQAEVTIP